MQTGAKVESIWVPNKVTSAAKSQKLSKILRLYSFLQLMNLYFSESGFQKSPKRQQVYLHTYCPSNKTGKAARRLHLRNRHQPSWPLQFLMV